MRRNVIAMLLSVSLIAGLFGTTPLYAAEATEQGTGQDFASIPLEDELTVAEEEETAMEPSSKVQMNRLLRIVGQLERKNRIHLMR